MVISFDTNTIVNGVKSIGNGAINAAKKVVTSEAAKKISLSAAVGAAGILGQKGCEKLIAKSEQIAVKESERKEERRLRKIEKRFVGMNGLSTEDCI